MKNIINQPFRPFVSQPLFKFILGIFCCICLINTSCVKNAVLPGDKDITAIILDHPNGTQFDTTGLKIIITNDTINITVPHNTDVTAIVPQITITGKTISPATNVQQDFSKPVTYTVTAADGTTKQYVVIVAKGGQSILYVGSSNKNFYALDALTGLLVWQFTGGGSFSFSSPTVSNGMVYAGCTDNNFYAFDALTGALKWKYATGLSIESSPAVVNGIVYFGSDDHNMYALDAVTGTLKWKYTTGFNLSSSPAVLNGIVYFGSDDGYITALDALTGQLKWNYSTQSLVGASSPAISNGVLYIGCRNGNLYALDAASGSLKWIFSTNGISLEESSPTIYNGVVYIAGWYNVPAFTQGGSLYAVDAQTGSLVWQQLNNIGISSSPFIADGNLYISCDDMNFYSLNATTGVTNWKAKILPNSSGATVYKGVVYVGGGGTWNIYAFDEVSGNVIWQFPVPQGLDNSSPCVLGGDGVVALPGVSGQQF